LMMLLLGVWPLLFGGELPGGLRPFRILLGVVYVLYMPGYALTSVLFPQSHDLDGVERIGLHLGLSVAWVPLLALLLNGLPGGIGLTSVLLGELGSVLLFSGIAIWRRQQLRSGAAAALEWQPRQWWHRFSPREQRLWGAAAVLVLGVFVATILTFTVPAKEEQTTAFYMLGASGLAEGFVRETAVLTDTAVTIGIANHERVAQTYRVEVWVVDAWTDTQTQVQTISEIVLAPGDKVEQPLTWQMAVPGDNQRVDILLFSSHSGDVKPYRQLRLWINVTE